MKLNRWQRELLKLKDKDNQQVALDLRNAYAKVLQDVRKQLKIYYADVDGLAYWQQLRLGKFQALEKQIVEILNNEHGAVVHVVEDYGIDQYQKGVSELFYSAEQNGLIVDFNLMDRDSIRIIVENQMDGMRLSEKLWSNRVELARQIDGVLVNGLTQGLSYREMAKRIELALNTDYKKAIRIARTEASRVYGLGQVEAHKDAEKLGFAVRKQWVSALDGRTRASHARLDGAIIEAHLKFRTDSGQAMAPGLFGVAKEDINCRCSVITLLDDDTTPTTRRATTYDINGNRTGTEIIKYKNYQDWWKDKQNGRTK